MSTFQFFPGHCLQPEVTGEPATFWISLPVSGGSPRPIFGLASGGIGSFDFRQAL